MSAPSLTSPRATINSRGSLEVELKWAPTCLWNGTEHGADMSLKPTVCSDEVISYFCFYLSASWIYLPFQILSYVDLNMKVWLCFSHKKPTILTILWSTSKFPWRVGMHTRERWYQLSPANYCDLQILQVTFLAMPAICESLRWFPFTHCSTLQIYILVPGAVPIVSSSFIERINEFCVYMPQ